MATYLAITTTNVQYGYIVIAAGENKAAVEAAAEKNISNHSTGIYEETELKNLVVVSKTAARRQYGVNWKTYELSDRYEWVS